MGKPLIFSKVTMGNLFTKSPCKMYPAVPQKYYEKTVGHIENDITVCIFCGTCKRACPSHAIEVDRKAGTWQINRFRCVTCLNCVRACPKSCLRNEHDYIAPSTCEVVDVLHRPDQDESSAS